MITENDRAQETGIPKWRSAEKEFSTEAEAVAFVKQFWEYVGYPWLERIQSQTTAAGLRELTVLDRTFLVVGKNSFKVSMYRNHDTNPLTEKAIEFLRSQGIQGVE